MPTYTYTCSSCGAFDLLRTISAREETAPCPSCDQPGTRVFNTAHLSRLNASLDHTVTAAGLSSETPQVTRHIPPAVRTTTATTRRPGYPALPRP